MIISSTILLVSIALILVFKSAYKQKEVPAVGCGTCRREIDSPINLKGKALFMANCSSCHFDPGKKGAEQSLRDIL
ncbi:MAG TPA: hypothetical protein VFJ43_08310, partial [Bacteroidia bacterium]|nr:hypothetical protein [Bacteroidia bacterium]